MMALRMPGKDYEDAVQVVSAQSATLDALVTRDPDDYKGVSLAVYSPLTFLEQLAES